jgi:hypothetical protein
MSVRVCARFSLQNMACLLPAQRRGSYAMTHIANPGQGLDDWNTTESSREMYGRAASRSDSHNVTRPEHGRSASCVGVSSAKHYVDQFAWTTMVYMLSTKTRILQRCSLSIVSQFKTVFGPHIGYHILDGRIGELQALQSRGQICGTHHV